METSGLTERELNARLRAGDEAAFEEVVSRFAGMVQAVCLRVLRDRAAAEDASQVVFMTLLSKAASFDHTVVVSVWLYRAAVHTAKKFQRSSGRRAKREKEAGEMRKVLLETGETVAEEAWGRISPELDAALEALPAYYRNVLVLHYLVGKKYREIAEELGVKESTVAMRIARGLEKLRLKLARSGVTVSTAVLGAALSVGARNVPSFFSPQVFLDNCRKAAHLYPRGAAVKESFRAAGGLSVSNLVVVAVGIVLAATTGVAYRYYGDETSPASSNRAGAAKTGEDVKKAAEMKNGWINKLWDFSKGPAKELKVVNGKWLWRRGKNGNAGVMHALPNQSVTVLLPIPISPRPHVLEVKLRCPLKAERKGNFGVRWANRAGTPQPLYPLRFPRSHLSVNPGKHYLLRTFVVGHLIVSVMNAKIVAAGRYDSIGPGKRLLVYVRNWDVEEIRLRTLTEKELPVFPRDWKQLR